MPSTSPWAPHRAVLPRWRSSSVVSAFCPPAGASRGDVVARLNETRRPPVAAALVRRQALGDAQVALALMLLAGAAVLAHGLARILRARMNASRLLVVAPDSAAAGRRPRGTSSICGCSSAFARNQAWRPPRSWKPPIATLTATDAERPIDGGAMEQDVSSTSMASTYFETVGIRFSRGRGITETDHASARRRRQQTRRASFLDDPSAIA